MFEQLLLSVASICATPLAPPLPMTDRRSLSNLGFGRRSSSSKRDSGSFSCGQIFKVSLPFFSMSETGMIASLGMGRLAAATKLLDF